MKFLITVNTAPLTEEQAVEMALAFKDCVLDGSPIQVGIGLTDYTLHPENIEVQS